MLYEVITDTLKIIRGEDPDRDAWLTNFYTENHLAYEAFPDYVASPEQLNFIVHLDGEKLYYPCSDKLFAAIIEKRADTMLTTAYMATWSRIEQLVKEIITDEFKQQYLLSLLSIKFQHETSSKVLLPSRLDKRLLTIFTHISEISRPLADVITSYSIHYTKLYDLGLIRLLFRSSSLQYSLPQKLLFPDFYNMQPLTRNSVFRN